MGVPRYVRFLFSMALGLLRRRSVHNKIEQPFVMVSIKNFNTQQHKQLLFFCQCLVCRLLNVEGKITNMWRNCFATIFVLHGILVMCRVRKEFYAFSESLIEEASKLFPPCFID
jgi:hypothetical protein